MAPLNPLFILNNLFILELSLVAPIYNESLKEKYDGILISLPFKTQMFYLLKLKTKKS
jgi:hypothetical protein